MLNPNKKYLEKYNLYRILCKIIRQYFFPFQRANWGLIGTLKEYINMAKKLKYFITSLFMSKWVWVRGSVSNLNVNRRVKVIYVRHSN